MAARRDTEDRRAFGGAFSIPTAGTSGVCMDGNYGRFMEPVRDNECVRVMFDGNADNVDDFEDACSGALNASTFLNLRLCEDYSSYGDCNSWVSLSEITAVSLPGGADMSGVASSTYDPATSTCYNALKELCITVEHDGNSKITKVVADVKVKDVTKTSESLVFLLSQKFSLEFASSADRAEGDAPSAYGNAVMRTRSGNPGYIQGLPVLFGNLTQEGSDEAILASIPGLQVLGSTTKAFCSSGGDSGTDLTQTVNFGEDFLSGCVINVTHAEFVDMCSQTGTYMTSVGPFDAVASDDDLTTSIDPAVPTYLALSWPSFYVGMFGNADPLDVSQWLQARVVGLSTTPTLSSDTRLCSNLVTSLQFRFLTAKVGELGNPQMKIIGAEIEYVTEDVRFAAETTSTQNLMLSSMVEFVELDTASAKVAAPPPPVLFSVPHDIFYPFYY